MEQQIIDFIVEYKWYLAGVATLIALTLVAFHARARALVLRFLKDASVDTFDNIEKKVPYIVDYIYNRLPVRYRAFITKKRIEKIILRIADRLGFLDKSK